MVGTFDERVAALERRLRDRGPVTLVGRSGSRVTDADGTVYVDLDAPALGHAHPRILRALEARIRAGGYGGGPTEDAVAVAEALARRFGLPRWRFVHGDPVFDAIAAVRAATGRTRIGSADDVLDRELAGVVVSPVGVDLPALRESTRALGILLAVDE
ncbi:MAG: hypothetical protein ABMB14_33730, partial [Myxococcota bacterium]